MNDSNWRRIQKEGFFARISSWIDIGSTNIFTTEDSASTSKGGGHLIIIIYARNEWTCPFALRVDAPGCEDVQIQL
jgi:hypothetical protein